MTLRTNARVAGVVFLLYIATAMSSLILFNRASGSDVGIGATLASLVRHEPLVRLTALLTMLQYVWAVVLGVTLYALTRDQDRDLAMLAMFGRFTEGLMGYIAADNRLQLLSVAKASAAATTAPDAAAAQALGAWLLGGHGIGPISFALASTIFCYLFLRARSIPAPLAWLGFLASALMVVVLPLQLAGVLRATGWGSAVTWITWMPLAVFELTLAVWLIVRGVAPATVSRTAPS
jgi:preprotein translocase subunit SecG